MASDSEVKSELKWAFGCGMLPLILLCSLPFMPWRGSDEARILALLGILYMVSIGWYFLLISLLAIFEFIVHLPEKLGVSGVQGVWVRALTALWLLTALSGTIAGALLWSRPTITKPRKVAPGMDVKVQLPHEGGLFGYWKSNSAIRAEACVTDAGGRKQPLALALGDVRSQNDVEWGSRISDDDDNRGERTGWISFKLPEDRALVGHQIQVAYSMDVVYPEGIADGFSSMTTRSLAGSVTVRSGRFRNARTTWNGDFEFEVSSPTVARLYRHLEVLAIVGVLLWSVPAIGYVLLRFF